MTATWTAADGTTLAVDERWLRSVCRCVECGDSAAGLRWFSPSALEDPATVVIRQLQVHDDRIDVHWADGHRSQHDRSRLEDRLVERPIDPTDAPVRSGLPADPLEPHGYPAVLTDDRALHDAIDELATHGVARFVDAPSAPTGTAEFAARFGPVRVTSYGAVQEFRTVPDPRTAAETGRPQIPHTDEPFRYSPPGFLFFHMAVAGPMGEGSTLLVDGFAAAEELRRTHPGSFEALAEIPVPLHRRHEGDVEFRTASRVISLAPDGSLDAIRYNSRCLADLDPLDPRTGDVLHALARFTSIVEDPDMQRTVHLESGTMLAFDNHRIMHGRTAFSDAHPRHLLSCNVDRDAVHSTWRVLSRRFGTPTVRLPQGPST